MLRSPLLFAFVILVVAARPVSAQAALDPTDLDADGVPGVASPSATGSEIPEVYGLTSPASLLIDRSHGENFDVTGFTSVLQSQGWVVAEHSGGPITGEVLASFDVLMVPARLLYSIVPFSAPEVTTIIAFVANGGGLWLFNEADIDPAGINSISSSFGVSFHADEIRDPTNNEGHDFWPTIYTLASHPITQGVASYGYYAGCCLAASSPAITIGMGDDDAFSSKCPIHPPTLATYESTGRVVFSGDNTPLFPGWYPDRLREGEELLLQNIANWLAQKPPTATGVTTWGGIKILFR